MERKDISRVGWGLFWLIVVTILSDLILEGIMIRLMPELAANSHMINIRSAICQYILGTAVFLWAVRKTRLYVPERRPLGGDNWMLVMVVSAFLLMAGNYLGTMLNDFLAPMLGHTPVNNLEEYMASVPLAYVFLTTVILAPITEEWIFRRGVLGRLLPLGQMPAVFLSALLFALFHGNLYQFFYAFFMGILLGFLYLETGSCRSSIGLHMAVNLCFGVIPTALYQHSGMIMAAFWQMFLLAVGAIGLVSFVYGRIRGTIFLWKRDAETMEGWCGLAFLNPGMILSMGACLVLLALNLFWS